jgi:putative acetyltransferase
MHIALENPDQPDVIRLIDELDAYQIPLYPLESDHGIDMDALRQPNVLFAVARSDTGEAVGCGAIVIEPEYGELKRMYVVPAQRSRGIAQRLLARLEAAARERGCRAFALETGFRQPEAIRFYERAGYMRCGPFGDYIDDPNSIFMRKPAAERA